MKIIAAISITFFCLQNIFAQNNTPPDMPTSPELSQPTPPQAQPLPAQMPPEPAPISPVETTPVQSQLPDDFELIAIKPYFKNKARLGHLTVTLLSGQNETLGKITGDFGDCKNCIRGASVKGKIGIRLYGNTMNDLTVSRKQSSSIKLENCPTNKVALTSNVFSCEFSHKDVKMKMTIKLEP